MTVAEAARRAKVSEQWVGNWKRQFLESGRAGLGWWRGGPVRAVVNSSLRPKSPT
ncbi:helix-turn-helix domain-containing protein [Actinacidiphila glaucinigra]